MSLPESSSGRLLVIIVLRNSWQRNDLKVGLAALFRQLLHAHVVENQQVRLQRTIQDSVVAFEGFVVHEAADAVEDAVVVRSEAIADELTTGTLHDVTFADSGRTNRNHDAMFAKEVARRQVDVSGVADDTYRGNAMGYAGQVHVEVRVATGKNETVRGTSHRERQFHAALMDTPGQVFECRGCVRSRCCR